MAVRIQLRRDTAANWVSADPVLRAGEIGIETDTLKFKIGTGATWTATANYANVTPTGLSNSLGDYILAADQGNPGGPAELDSNGDLLVPENSIILWDDADYTYTTTVTATQPTANRTITIPNSTGTLALTSDIITSTTGISEGTNLYFTDERAQDATAAALAAGTHTNITVTYNDNANSISLAAAPGYVDEQAVDAVAAALAAGTHTNISVSYNDNGNAISLTGAVTYTDENAQDAVGNAVGNGLDYDDNTGAISVDPSEFALNAVGAPTADVAMATYKITNLGTPTASSDAATKAYVDNTTAGLNFHAAVHGATTTNLSAIYDNGAGGVGATLTADTNRAWVGIDSHTTWAVGNRVLVKNQTTALQNGIYTIADIGVEGSSPWVLTRATDADNSPSGELANGDFCFVQNGGQAGYGFIVSTTGSITVGTTAISYVQFNAGQVVVAGSGLVEPVAGTLAIDTTVTADLSTAQTLTNKTLNSPNINEAVALTATATELNILDGATLSTTELNYVDGVTSSIQTQLNDKAPIASPTFTGTVSGITSSMVGLGNVDNTSDANKPVSTATQTALDLKVDESLFDAKGDILVGSADNTPVKLSVGTNGYLLTANSSATNGVEWAAAPISLPSQSGNSGKYLTTDGTNASWGTLVVPITTGTATVTANTATAIDNFVTGTLAIEYTVTLSQGSKVRTSKVLLHCDGTNVDMTEFAIMELNGTISGVAITASTSASAGYLNLTVTDAATTNVNVKFSKVML